MCWSVTLCDISSCAAWLECRTESLIWWLFTFPQKANSDVTFSGFFFFPSPSLTFYLQHEPPPPRHPSFTLKTFLTERLDLVSLCGVDEAILKTILRDNTGGMYVCAATWEQFISRSASPATWFQLHGAVLGACGGYESPSETPHTCLLFFKEKSLGSAKCVNYSDFFKGLPN